MDWEAMQRAAEEKRDHYAAAVRDGLFGTVCAEWTASDGWLDGFQAIHFTVECDGEYITIKANDSGVFRQCAGGGWARFIPTGRTEPCADCGKPVPVCSDWPADAPVWCLEHYPRKPICQAPRSGVESDGGHTTAEANADGRTEPCADCGRPVPVHPDWPAGATVWCLECYNAYLEG